MNIVFVAPPFPNRVSEYLILPSLELCIQSSILKKLGHAVHLVDMRIENTSLSEGVQQVAHHDPDFILIDDEPRAHCNTVQLIPMLRATLGEAVKICIRGEIPSFIPETTMERNPDLDYIVRFDDDYCVSRILASRSTMKLSTIPNIAFRTEEDCVCVTPVLVGRYPLDELPYPDRHLYDIEKYLRRDTETIVKSARGCPGKCLFCIKTKFEPFRAFSIPRFCNEIEELQNMGFQSFFFADDTFSFSDSRVDEFYQEVMRRGMKIKWTSNMRISDINEYKISRMKEAGAYRVFVGIETVNKKTQKTIHKNLAESIIKEKIAILKKYHIEFHASFILGNPGDTVEDIDDMIRFVKEIEPTIVTFNMIRVYPGLDLYANPGKYGIIMKDPYWYEKDTWSYQAVMGTTDLPPEILEGLSRKCLFEFIQ